MNTETTAINAFIENKAKIDMMLKKLSKASADHFDANPEEINWGDVGRIGHIVEKLQELVDQLEA